MSDADVWMLVGEGCTSFLFLWTWAALVIWEKGYDR
jgi:hypothetical protein